MQLALGTGASCLALMQEMAPGRQENIAQLVRQPGVRSCSFRLSTADREAASKCRHCSGCCQGQGSLMCLAQAAAVTALEADVDSLMDRPSHSCLMQGVALAHNQTQCFSLHKIYPNQKISLSCLQQAPCTPTMNLRTSIKALRRSL